LATGVQTEHGMQTVFYLAHVPKCAGQTVERYTEQILPPEAILRPKKAAPVVRYLTGRGWRRPPGLDPAAVRVVSGHFMGRDIGALLPAHQPRESILVRDPVGLFLSWYNYRMTRYRSQGRAIPPFEAWYETQGRNPVTRHLFTRHLNWSTPRFLATPVGRLATEATAVLDGFWFVASYRRVDDLLAAVAAHFGTSVTPRHVNRTDYAFRTLASLDPGFVSRLDRENALDAYIYARYADRLFDPAATAAAEMPRSSSTLGGYEARRAAWCVREALPIIGSARAG
jgi:hypothetical protein